MNCNLSAELMEEVRRYSKPWPQGKALDEVVHFNKASLGELLVMADVFGECPFTIIYTEFNRPTRKRKGILMKYIVCRVESASWSYFRDGEGEMVRVFTFNLRSGYDGRTIYTLTRTL